MSNNSFARGYISIRAQKPPQHRRIIPGVEVIEPCFLIVIIPAVAEGVQGGYVQPGGIGLAYNVPPSIVLVGGNNGPVNALKQPHWL